MSSARTVVCSGRESSAWQCMEGCGGALLQAAAPAPVSPPAPAQRSATVPRSADSTSRRISDRVNPDRPSGPTAILHNLL